LSAEALPPDAEFLILSWGEEGATATGTGDMRETVAEAAKESEAIQLRKGNKCMFKRTGKCKFDNNVDFLGRKSTR
jgi:hypothetical protein